MLINPTKMMTSIVGVLLYSQFVIGAIFENFSGLSIITFFAAAISIILIVYDRSINSNFVYIVLVANFIFFSSLLLSRFSAYSIDKFIFLVLKFSSMLVIGYAISGRSKLFFDSAVIPLYIFLIICFFSLSDSTMGVNNRLEVGLYNPIWISRHLLELFLICMFFLEKNKYFLIPIFSLCLIVTYYAGSKGGLAALAVTYIYFNLTNDKYKYRFLKVLLIIFATVIILVYLYRSFDNSSYMIQRFLSVVPEGSSESIVNESRLVVWPRSISLLSDLDISEYLFGFGIGGFSEFYYGVDQGVKFYPHNIVIELVVEFGFIGASLFLWLLFFYVYKCRNIKESLMVVYFFTAAQFSGDLPLNEFLFLYLGILIGKYSCEKKKAPVVRYI